MYPKPGNSFAAGHKRTSSVMGRASRFMRLASRSTLALASVSASSSASFLFRK